MQQLQTENMSEAGFTWFSRLHYFHMGHTWHPIHVAHNFNLTPEKKKKIQTDID